MTTTSVTLATVAGFGNPLWRNAGTNPLTNAALPAAIASAGVVYKVSTTQSAELLLPLQTVSLTAIITAMQVIITTAVQTTAPNLPTVVSLGVLTNGTYQYTQAQALTLGAVNTLLFPTKPDGTQWTQPDIVNTVVKIIDQSTSGEGNLASLAVNAISTTIPTVTITPITTITSSTPQITWAYTDGDLALQSGYQVQIIDLSNGAAVFDSGFITGPDTAYTVPANPTLPNHIVTTAPVFNPVTGTSGGTWAAVATSSDGVKVYAVGASGIYLSVNSGATFALVAGTNIYSWTSVACSADGTKVFVCASNLASAIWFSSNSGASFSPVAATAAPAAIACSSTGSNVVVAGNSGGPISLSTNFGLTFTAVSGTTGKNWTTIACDATATHIYAGTSDGFFYISSNSGVSFAPTTVSANGLTAVNGIACSSDGLKVFTTAQEGITSANAGPNGTVNALAVQTDGKIVLGGAFTTYDGTSSVRVARISNAGILDATFTTNIGTGANGVVTSVVVQPSDQKILVAGFFTAFNGTTVNRICRLNTDGTLDSTFTTNIGAAANAVINAVAVNATDGTIILGGAFTAFNGTSINRVARLSSAGVFDTTFATNVSTAASDGIACVIIQPSDGKIVLGGYFATFHGTAVYCIIRLNTDGTNDTGFVPNIGTGVIYAVNSMAIQSNGKIVIGGLFYTPFSTTYTSNAIRLNTDGTTDATFLSSIGGSVNAQILAVAVQASDQKILLSGGFTTFNATATYSVVRLNTDGTTDTTFVTNTGTASNNEIHAMALQTDNRILLGGAFTAFNGLTANEIIRIDPDGTRDLTFIGRLAIWVSTNSGGTFAVVTATYGTPFDGISCAADGVHVYATAYSSTGTSLNGIYVSADSGATFTAVSGTSGVSWSGLVVSVYAAVVYATANVGSIWVLVNTLQYKYQVRVAKNVTGYNSFTAYSSFTPTSSAFNDTLPTVAISLQAHNPTLAIALPNVTGLGYATRSVAVLRLWSNGYGLIRNGTIANVGLGATTVQITDLESPTGATVSYAVKALYYDAAGNEYVGSPVFASIAVPFASTWHIQKCDGVDVGVSVLALLSGGLNVTRNRPQTHQYPLGQRYPITTSGTVQGYDGEFVIYFDNQPAFIAFLPYLDYIGKLLVTAPNGAYKYITLDKDDVQNAKGRGTDIVREMKLTYTEEDSGLGFNEPVLYEF